MSAVMVEWDPKIILPNLDLTHAIGNELIAIAPVRDPRVKAVCAEHENYEILLSKFKDSFGVPVQPASLMVRHDAPIKVSSAASVASFRDLSAISVILHNRSENILNAQNHRVLWGETFSFYPWMIGSDWDTFTAHTPAMQAIHTLDAFSGQSSPSLSRIQVRYRDVDLVLFGALSARWDECYTVDEPKWPDLALMRSLNMAYQATMLPAGAETGIYDIGRIIALWVSAFETLVHPGNGQVGLKDVFDLIEKAPWIYQYSANAIHETGRNKLQAQRTACSVIYERIYSLRNDFLHGNPIKSEQLRVPEVALNIFECAAPLYRIALTSFLDLRFSEEPPLRKDAEAFGRYYNKKMQFQFGQKVAEQVLGFYGAGKGFVLPR
jgi:hypothetical protein